MAGTDVEWTGNQKAYNAINYLNQIFAFTVRSNGKGYNSERCLMIPGYAASSSLNILQSICIPTFEGDAVKNIIISVHSYNPYSFCLSDEMFDFDPENKEHTGSIDRFFTNLEETFLFNDIPVVIGETGATEKNNTEQRENWAEYMGRKAVEYGIPICIWDNGHNGHSGGECHAWILRSALEWNYPSVVDKLFSAYNTIEWGSVTAADRVIRDNERPPVKESIIDGTTIWENKEGQTVAGITLSHAQPISIPMQRNYIVLAADLAVAYSGDAEPLLYLTNEDNSVSTDGIAPYKTETVSDKKIAYYKYRDINLSLESSGIGYVAKAKNLIVASSGSDISVYEMATVSLNPEITYYIGGQTFNDLSNVSTLPGLKILGWYTTMDYRPGTELGENPGASVKVYGKLVWVKDTVALAKYGIDPDAETVSPTPEVTETPTSTEAPTATEVPIATEAPVTTETPAATETPVITESPDITESPAATKAPEGSGSAPKEKVESENSSGLWITILVIVVPVCIIIIIFIIWIIRKKK